MSKNDPLAKPKASTAPAPSLEVAKAQPAPASLDPQPEPSTEDVSELAGEPEDIPPPVPAGPSPRFRVTKGGLAHLRSGMTMVNKGKEFGVDYLAAHEKELAESGIVWERI